MSGRPARVVVAGAGPAGFYVAINLLRLFGPSGVRVDVLERLPVPFGLVRFGIAPDHAHTRAVTSRFDRAVRDHGDALRVHVNAGVRTQLGREGVPVNELMRASDALVLCTGLSAEPGYGDGRRHDQQQRLRGVLDAREVVDWYNGHPYARADVGETLRNVLHSEDARGVAVLGVGNVALDIARMLALDPVSLSRTDAAPAAIEVLSSGSDFPRLVHMIGRRSLAQASFTPKEVRELLSLLSARVTSGNDDGLAIDATDEIVMRENRIRKRALEAVRKHVTSPPSPAQDSQPTREVRMHFRRTPIDIVEDEVRSGHVGGIRLRVTPPASAEGERVGGESHDHVQKEEFLRCGAVIRAFGYRGTPVAGVPWDETKGTVPTVAGGRVVAGDDHTVVPGLYASGWLRRGASGIIATNVTDAEEVAAAVHHDFMSGILRDDENGNGNEENDSVLNVLKLHGIGDDVYNVASVRAS